MVNDGGVQTPYVSARGCQNHPDPWPLKTASAICPPRGAGVTGARGSPLSLPHRARARRAVQEEARKLAKSMELVEKGEFSHASCELRSRGLAPGTPATLTELRDAELRPRYPSEPMPENALQMRPSESPALDKDVFGAVLRKSRRGESASFSGNRSEYLRRCF